MTAPTARRRYLMDQFVMSRYWVSKGVKAQIDKLAISGILCSSMITIDEARFSARSSNDLTFLTDLYGKKFLWLPFDVSI